MTDQATTTREIRDQITETTKRLEEVQIDLESFFNGSIGLPSDVASSLEEAIARFGLIEDALLAARAALR